MTLSHTNHTEWESVLDNLQKKTKRMECRLIFQTQEPKGKRHALTYLHICGDIIYAISDAVFKLIK